MGCTASSKVALPSTASLSPSLPKEQIKPTLLQARSCGPAKRPPLSHAEILSATTWWSSGGGSSETDGEQCVSQDVRKQLQDGEGGITVAQPSSVCRGGKDNTLEENEVYPSRTQRCPEDGLIDSSAASCSVQCDFGRSWMHICQGCQVSAPEPPLLFPIKEESQPHLQHSHSLELKYKMYLMPVPTLLQMEALEPHQVLLQKGMLLEWTPEMDGRIIFVSHQWLGVEHPDPAGEHLAALKHLLLQLMSGEIPKVDVHWKQHMITKNTCIVTSAEWAAALPHMFVWIDYAGVPQLGASNMDGISQQEAKQILPAHAEDLEPMSPQVRRLSTVSTKCESVGETDDESVPCLHCDKQTDHRLQGGNSECQQAEIDALQEAIDSIPGYVERSSLMLVLVPACQNSLTQETCNYSTWRSRGWCRVEFMAAHLAQRDIRVMVCPGSEPFFVFPVDAMHLPAGEGDFTCCSLKHTINGRSIPCDKDSVKSVVQSMLHAKVDRLRRNGDREKSFFYTALARGFLQGFECEDSSVPVDGVAVAFDSSVNAETAVQRLQQQLSWRPADAEAASTSGWSTLMLAAMGDDLAAVRELLNAGVGDGINLGLGQKWPELCCLPAGFTPLMAAMSFARFEVVETLLDAQADPTIVDADGRGVDAFMLACVFGRVDNAERWLRRFPSWDLERRDGTIGGMALHAACGYPPQSAALVAMLLSAGASANSVTDMGTSALQILGIKEDLDLEAARLLLAAKADVNYRTQPRTLKWRVAMACARAAWRMGRRQPIIHLLARAEGATAQHRASAHGHGALVKLLREAGAEEGAMNSLGEVPGGECTGS